MVFGLLISSLSYAQNPVLNPSFENWTLGEPDDWSTNNATGFTMPIQQSTNGHSGSFAVNGFVTQVGINTPFPPYLVSSDAGGNPHPISLSYTNLSFYYKLDLTGTGEFFNAGVVISDAQQSGIGGGSLEFFSNSNTNTYTLANVPITYVPGSVPAGAIISFVIGDTTSTSTGLQVGSNFRLDDVSLNFVSGVSGNEVSNSLRAPYPCPATDYINIPFSLDDDEYTELFIYNVQGLEINRYGLAGLSKGSYKEVIDISDLAPGIYSVCLKTNGIQKGFTTFIVGDK